MLSRYQADGSTKTDTEPTHAKATSLPKQKQVIKLVMLNGKLDEKKSVTSNSQKKHRTAKNEQGNQREGNQTGSFIVNRT
jgi:hypothetical protein